MLKQFAAVLVVLLLTIGTATAEDSPNTVIESAVNELAEKMDGRKEELADDRQALYAIIDGILLPRFDSRFAAQLVLARHWR
ncbi:MAG: ABC transporter substrate-binding protein, partial [Woeseiaceae bacterium]